MKTGICIYHANCMDGFAAAFAVWKRYGENFEYIEANYGNEPPAIDGKIVYIVDFSYPKHILLQMEKLARGITVIDHHKTSKQDLDGLPFCIFDLTKSGAVLTWEHLFPTEPVPLILQYIQDRDLWIWQLYESKECSAGLRLEKWTFESFHKLLDPTETMKLVLEGCTVLKYQNGCVQAAKENDIRRIDLDGYYVPIVNCTHLISEIVGELAENEPFAVGYFDTIDKRVFSLRSRKGGVDVSAIAKNHGGGGHPNAAGFTIPLPEIL